jgi:hypothetical protein
MLMVPANIDQASREKRSLCRVEQLHGVVVSYDLAGHKQGNARSRLQ